MPKGSRPNPTSSCFPPPIVPDFGGRGLTAAASRRGDPRSFERNTIPESGLAAECGGLREWLDHHVTIRQNHPLRREVVDVGRDFDEGETLLPANSPSHIHR